METTTDLQPTTQPRPPLTVLHVCSGPYHPEKLHPNFRDGWREVRLDADAGAKPDILAAPTDLSMVQTGSIHAIWCPYGLVRLWAHEVPQALKEFQRVLRPDGFALITVPDLQRVAEHVVSDQLDAELFASPAGPITVRDVMYGHGRTLAAGDLAMAHRTGFTAKTLGHAILDAGFANVDINRSRYDLWALAEKSPRA
jgi:hypothetical protein